MRAKGGMPLKYLILVHHDEEAFEKISETKRKELLSGIRATHAPAPATMGNMCTRRLSTRLRRRPASGCATASGS